MKLKNFTQKDRHGNMISYDFYESDDNMGVPEMQSIPQHPGSPKGTDTVPAWLTPGEFVMNAEATRMFEPQIEQMNNAGRAVQAQQGGTIPEYAASGQKITKRKMPNGKIGLWKGNTYLGIHEEGPSFLGDISEAAKEGWEEWNPFKSNGGSVPPVYLAEGSGGFFDKLLNMFSDDDTPKVPDATQAVVPPPDSSRADRVAALVEASKTDGPTRPDPTISNKMYMDFLKNKEGFRNEAYLDSAGVPTIGYGFTEGVQMGDTIDEKTANERLLKEMAKTDQDYNKLVTADLNPNQQAAVKSLLYNIGGPQFANSKARAALNAGDFESFKKEASEFRMADGKVIPGLENRRRDELELFFKPYKADRPETSNAPMSMVSPEEQAAFQRDVEAAQKATREQGMYDPDGAGAANKAVAEQSRILEDQRRMQQGQVPPMIGAAVPPKPTDDPLVSTVPPSNTSRDDRVDVLNNAAKGGNTVIGTLQGNDVYQDDLGEYINTPEGPVYLDGNQLQAMTKTPASVPPSSTVPVIPPSNTSRDDRVAKLTNPGTTPNVVPELKAPPVGKQVGPDNKFDLNKDGILTDAEIKAGAKGMLSGVTDKPTTGSASAPLGVMPTSGQIVIQGPDSLIARQKQILNDMVAANAPPAEIYAQQQKIDRINNIAPRQEAFSDVVEAQNKIEPINSQIEDLETQIERLEAAGLYEKANTLRSEVASLNAQKPQLEADLTAATEAQDKLYRDATLPDGTVIPSVGKVTADQLESDGSIPPPMDASIPDELSGPEMSSPVPKLEETPPPPTGLPDELQAGQEMNSNKGIALKEVIEKTEGDNTTTGQTPKVVEDAGKTAPPEQINEAESFLSGIFGDLFDSDELKRMAIMYVGSRLMGGSHNGSMNFAAKQYVKRVDAKAAEKKALDKEKRLDKKALAKERRQNVFSLIEKGKKTKDSIAAYEKSGDPRDLVDKPVLTKPPIRTGTVKTFYDKGGRGKVTAVEMKDDNGNIFYVNSQGKQLNPFAFHEDSSLVPNTQAYIDRELKIGKQMGDALEDLIKRDTITVDKKEIKPVGFASGSQGIEVARWMNKNNIPVNYMGSILESAYAAAAAEQKETGNKVTSIGSYLDKAFIDRIPGNESIFTREDGERVDSGTVMNLIGQGVSILRSKPGQESKSDEQLQNDMLAEMRREWFALDDKVRGEYNTKGTNDGETGFMVFMQQQIAEDVKQS